LIKSAKSGAFSECDKNLGYFAVCIRQYPKAARMKHFVMWAKLASPHFLSIVSHKSQ
jgi:hypothetical protein